MIDRIVSPLAAVGQIGPLHLDATSVGDGPNARAMPARITRA